MMPRLLRAAAVIILVFGLSAAVSADTLTLRSGRVVDARFSGMIVIASHEFLVFELDDGTILKVDRDEVASIVFAGGTPAAAGAPVGAAATAPAQEAGATGPGPGSGPAAPGVPVAAPAAPAAAPTAPQPSTRDAEPNNDGPSATFVAVNTGITGPLEQAGDADFYRVSVGTLGHFSVTCTQPFDMSLFLLDSLGNVLAGGDFGGTGTLMDMRCDIFSGGDYYVKVTGYSPNLFSADPYTLRIGFTEGRSDAWEPNETRVSAHVPPLSRPFDAYLSSPADRDYYRIDVAVPTTVRITSTQPLDYWLDLLGADGTTALAGGDMGGAGTRMYIEKDLLEAGTYYILMRPYATAYSMDTPYTISIEAVAGHTDTWEPNDTPEQAYRPPFGQTLAAYISGPTDKDYYRVDLAGPASIAVTSDQPEDYYLAILGSDGKSQLAGGDFGGKDAPMVAKYDALAAGTLYVIMKSYSNAYSMRRPYSIRIDVTPAAHDPNEPNDTLAEARAILPGRTVTGYLTTPGDKDFFTFEVVKGGTVKVAATQPADFILELLDSSGTVIAGGDLGGVGIPMLFSRAIEPGKYYLVMRPYGSNYNMHAPYELTVTVTLP